MWAGLFFSYSQSSMVALVVVTARDRARRPAPRGSAAVGDAGFAARRAGRGRLLRIGGLGGRSLRRETSDRTQRIEDTARVVERRPARRRRDRRPAEASRRLVGPRPAQRRFVSHNDAADRRGRARRRSGCVLYLWLLVGGARRSRRVRPARTWRSASASAPLPRRCSCTPLLSAASSRTRSPGSCSGSRRGYLSWPRRDDGVHIARGARARAAVCRRARHRPAGTALGPARAALADRRLGAARRRCFALVAIDLPELGSDPWPFKPGSVVDPTASSARS